MTTTFTGNVRYFAPRPLDHREKQRLCVLAALLGFAEIHLA